MSKSDSSEVGFVCMLPALLLQPSNIPSDGPSLNDLPNDIKMKIIDSFSSESNTTSCRQILELCKDAPLDEAQYKELFVIQVNKLNWPPGVNWPPVPVHRDATLRIPNNQASWKLAYEFECTRFHETLAIVKGNVLWPHSFYYYNANMEMLLAAMETSDVSLLYVADKLKNDPQKADIYREIVLAAVKKRGCNLISASENLQNNREFVLAVVRKNGLALGYVKTHLKENSDIVLAAVEENGLALKEAPWTFKGDPAIVLAAVENNGLALEFASEELKKTRAIVLAAVKNNRLALNLVSEEVKNDVLAHLNAELWLERLCSPALTPSCGELTQALRERAKASAEEHFTTFTEIFHNVRCNQFQRFDCEGDRRF